MPSVPKTMQAVVYRGIDDLRLETLPVPRIGPGDLLVQVAACGVCPTDIKKIHYGTVPPPRIFGHETAGVIARVGARVRGFRVGARVALHHHVPCLHCHACRHRAFAQCPQYKRTGITAGFTPAGGGYAQYVRVMDFVLPGVVKIPARNTFIEGAMLEPVNTVLKAVNRLTLLRGDTVLVAGQGPIGLLFTRLLALRGMKVLATDLLEPRLQLAREWGAKWTLNPGAAPVPPRPVGVQSRTRDRSPSMISLIRRLTQRRGLDAAIIAVPSDAAVLQALELIRGGGQVLTFAHTRRGLPTPLDLATICVDEKDLLGSYSTDFTLQNAVSRLVFSRRLDVRHLVTHEFPLSETAAAVELASHPHPESMKIMVIPGL